VGVELKECWDPRPKENRIENQLPCETGILNSFAAIKARLPLFLFPRGSEMCRNGRSKDVKLGSAENEVSLQCSTPAFTLRPDVFLKTAKCL
jgi:hypothetical protein